MELLEEINNNIQIKDDVLKKIKEYEKISLQKDILYQQLKEELIEVMKNNKTLVDLSNSLEHGLFINATYKAPTTKKIIDSTRLKKELPDVYEEYLKISNVKESITLKIEV